MVDEDKIRRKVILRTAGHPLVLAPLIAGATVMAGVMVLTQRTALGVFAGLAGFLTSLGSYLTRMIFRGEKTAQEIIEEAARAEYETRQAALDELDRALAAEDRDPRPEGILRDLRALVQAFDQIDDASLGPNVVAGVEIRLRVDQLFEHCVSSIHQTRHFWNTAQKLVSPAARQPLLEQRETIIKDIQATLKQLSNTLVGLQSLDLAQTSPRHLQRMREELDHTLESARKVDSRVDALLNDRGYDESEFSDPQPPQVKG